MWHGQGVILCYPHHHWGHGLRGRNDECMTRSVKFCLPLSHQGGCWDQPCRHCPLLLPIPFPFLQDTAPVSGAEKRSWCGKYPWATEQQRWPWTQPSWKQTHTAKWSGAEQCEAMAPCGIEPAEHSSPENNRWHSTDGPDTGGVSIIVFHCLGLRVGKTVGGEHPLSCLCLGMPSGAAWEQPPSCLCPGGCADSTHRECPPSCLCPGSHTELRQGGEQLLCAKHLIFPYTFVIYIAAVTVRSLFQGCLLSVNCYLNP